MLDSRMRVLFKIEQRAATEILYLINEVEKRELYLKIGYSSLFAWLTDGIGYANAAAQRRIDSARLLRSLPRMHEAIGSKLESGALNLTKLAALQTAIRREEKSTGAKIDPRRKAELLKAIEFAPSYETERILASEFDSRQREPLRVVPAEPGPQTVSLTKLQVQLLERVRELSNNAYTDASFAEIVEMLAKDFIRRNAKTDGTTPVPRKRTQENVRRWWD